MEDNLRKINRHLKYSLDDLDSASDLLDEVLIEKHKKKSLKYKEYKERIDNL